MNTATNKQASAVEMRGSRESLRKGDAREATAVNVNVNVCVCVCDDQQYSHGSPRPNNG